MEKFQQTMNDWFELTKQLKDECKEYLIRVLKEHKGEIDWSEEGLDDYVQMKYYDRYGELAGWTDVYGVKLGKNNTITFIGEDGDSTYEEMHDDDLFAVCSFINEKVLPVIG